jgi:hypothetical protein
MTFEKWFKDELHFYCPSESDGRITALLLPEFKSVAFMAWNAALKTVEGQKPPTNSGLMQLLCGWKKFYESNDCPATSISNDLYERTNAVLA